MRGLVKELTPSVARSLPFALYLIFLALELAIAAWLPGYDGRWLYPVKVVLVAGALLVLWPHYTELSYTELKFGRLTPVPLTVSVVMGLIILAIWVNLDADWMLIGTPGSAYHPLENAGQTVYIWIVFRLMGAALVVPIMEELFWRSFLMRWLHQADFLQLNPAQIGIRALLITSLLFAVEHTQWLAGLIAGLAYGGLYIYTRTLWAPILAHAVTNAGLGIYVLMTRRWQFW